MKRIVTSPPPPCAVAPRVHLIIASGRDHLIHRCPLYSCSSSCPPASAPSAPAPHTTSTGSPLLCVPRTNSTCSAVCTKLNCFLRQALRSISTFLGRSLCCLLSRSSVHTLTSCDCFAFTYASLSHVCFDCLPLHAAQLLALALLLPGCTIYCAAQCSKLTAQLAYGDRMTRPLHPPAPQESVPLLSSRLFSRETINAVFRRGEEGADASGEYGGS